MTKTSGASETEILNSQFSILNSQFPMPAASPPENAQEFSCSMVVVPSRAHQARSHYAPDTLKGGHRAAGEPILTCRLSAPFPSESRKIVFQKTGGRVISAGLLLCGDAGQHWSGPAY